MRSVFARGLLPVLIALGLPGIALGRADAQTTCPANTSPSAAAVTNGGYWDDGAPQCRTTPIPAATNEVETSITAGTGQPTFNLRVETDGNGASTLTSVVCTDEVLPRAPALPNRESLRFLQTATNVACTISATDFNGRAYTAVFTILGVTDAGGVVSVARSAITLDGAGSVFDTTPPGVTVTTAATSATAGTPFTATFTFTEEVTGFVQGDITATNATVSAFATVSASQYTATITPAGPGPVEVSVAAGVANDLNGNTNTASNALGLTVYDGPQIVQDALQARAAALLAAQPDLRTRTGPGSAGVAVRATRGFGTFALDTGGGPVWLAVQGHWSETGTNRLSFGMATLGLQHETAGGAVGALVQLDLGTHTGPVGAEVAGRGLAVGPYVVQELGNGLSFDGRLLLGRTLNDVTLGAGNTARNVDGARVLATAQLTRTTPLGTSGVVLNPRASLGYVRESLEGFTAGGTAVAAQAFTLGEAVLGGDLRVPASGTLTLTMGLAAHWAYQQSSGGGVPSTTLPDTARGRIDLGAEFAARNGLSARAGVYRDGLGTTGYRAQGATVRVDWQF